MSQQEVPAASSRSLTARAARIDHDWVYWGLEAAAPLASFKQGDVVFGDPAIREERPDLVYMDLDCDLSHGTHKLVAPDDITHPNWHFAPLAPSQVKTVPGVPSIDQAFHDFMVNGVNGEKAKAWRAWFEKSVDNKGAAG